MAICWTTGNRVVCLDRPNLPNVCWLIEVFCLGLFWYECKLIISGAFYLISTGTRLLTVLSRATKLNAVYECVSASVQLSKSIKLS